MRSKRLWGAAAVLIVMGSVWLALEPPERATEPRATSDAVNDAAEPAPEAAAPSPERASPRRSEPSAPGAELPQPSAAEAPASAATREPEPNELPNAPRKHVADTMRLHFANRPETPTPGLGLSKAACAELRQRQLNAESLTERERLHLTFDCRGR